MVDLKNGPSCNANSCNFPTTPTILYCSQQNANILETLEYIGIYTTKNSLVLEFDSPVVTYTLQTCNF